MYRKQDSSADTRSPEFERKSAICITTITTIRNSTVVKYCKLIGDSRQLNTTITAIWKHERCKVSQTNLRQSTSEYNDYNYMENGLCALDDMLVNLF